jgi:hypothetical protein
MAALRLLLVSSCLCLVLQSQLALADEKSVLLEFKKAVDPDGNKVFWDESKEVCNFDGVSCTGGKVSSM